MPVDRTCFYYLNGACYNHRNRERKCCDPTPECEFYRAALSYISLKEAYLKGRPICDGEHREE